MVDTEKKEVMLYSFEKNKGEYNINNYETYKGSDVIKSMAFNGLEIGLDELFMD